MPRHGRVRRVKAWPGMAQHSTARQSTVRHGTVAQQSTQERSTAWHSRVRHRGTAEYAKSKAQHRSRARHNTAQHGTAQHGTAERGAARRGTARHGTPGGHSSTSGVLIRHAKRAVDVGWSTKTKGHAKRDAELYHTCTLRTPTEHSQSYPRMHAPSRSRRPPINPLRWARCIVCPSDNIAGFFMIRGHLLTVIVINRPAEGIHPPFLLRDRRI